jgi:hypothetical protein
MKGLRLAIQILLFAVVVFLAYMLYSSIMEPVRYTKVKAEREQIIIDKLSHIRDLQIEYKLIYGHYCSSFDSLKDFYLNGKMPVVLKVGTNDTLTEAKALELKLISRDTTYLNIKDTLFKDLESFNIEKIDIIPFTDGKVKFSLKTGMVDRANFKVPVLEITAKMSDYLGDIEQQELLENEMIIISKTDKFPGLKLGSLEEPMIDGNW